MFVEILQFFQDDATHKRVVKPGEVLEFSELRAKALIGGGLVRESAIKTESILYPSPPDIGQIPQSMAEDEEAAQPATTGRGRGR